MFAHFYEYYRNLKKILELHDLGGRRRCQEIRDICMDFEPCLKVHNLISVQHKSINPYQRDLLFGGVKLSMG